MEKENWNNLINKIHDFCENRNKIVNIYEQKKRHSNGNILDCLKLKEPDHSRILAGILNYYNNTEPYNLLSFIRMLVNKCEDIERVLAYINKTEIKNEDELKDSCISDDKTEIDNEDEWIDCLISDNENYAIIIENKIYDATDQETQIERYIDTVKERGIDEKNIFVVYLTKDGSKIVADHSFTEKARNALDFKDDEEAGRFINLNFRDDILPWLQEIIAETRYKDYLFIEFIDQYIDRLKGEFEFREIDKIGDEEIMEELNKVFGLTEKNDREKFDELTKIKNELDIIYKEIDKSLESIKEPILNVFKSIGEKNNNIKPADHLVNRDGFDFCYQIFIFNNTKEQSLFPSNFHFEFMWDEKKKIVDIDKFDIYLHDEDRKGKRPYKNKLILDKKFNDMIKSMDYQIVNDQSRDIIHKEIKFSDKLIDIVQTELPKKLVEEYKYMNEIAKYIIDKL